MAAQPPVIDPVAPVRSYEIVAEHPHDAAAFTQGLILHDGNLYEGTGLHGSSELRLVDLSTGDVLESSGMTAKATRASCQLSNNMAMMMPPRLKMERNRPVIDHVTKSCNTPTSPIRRLMSRPTL